MTMTQRYAEMLRRHAGEMDATGTPPVKSEAIRQAARHMEDIARTLNSIARPWQPMKTAPMDGSIVLVLLDGVDYPHPAYWLTGPDSQRAISNGNNAPGWRMALDAAPIADLDGPRYWMDCPDAPDDGGPEDA